MEILELRNTIMEMKNLLDGLISEWTQQMEESVNFKIDQ